MSNPKSFNAKTEPDLNLNGLAAKYARQLEIMGELNQLIASEQATDLIFERTLQHLVDTLAYHAAQIYRISASGQELWLHLELTSGHKSTQTQPDDVFSIDDETIMGEAIKKGELVYYPDIHHGPYTYHNQDEAQPVEGSEAASVLKSGQTPLGVLRVQSKETENFDQPDLIFLSSLSCLLAAAIKNNQKVEQLEYNLKEIKTHYSLQSTKGSDKQLPAGDKGVLPGYQYNRNSVAITQVDELPVSAKSTLTDDQVGISTIQNDEQNELIAPIKLHGETIGVLGIENDTDGTEWSTDDIRLLEEVSSQVALAIENSRLLQQTQQRTNELAILFETSRQLSESIDIQQHYQVLASQVAEFFNADVCIVALLNKVRTHFEEVILARAEPYEPKQAGVSVSEQPRRAAIDDYPVLQDILDRPEVIVKYLDQPLLPFLHEDEIENAIRSEHHQKAKDQHETHTCAIFPIIVRNKFVGLVKVKHFYQRYDYSKNELRLAQAIIAQVTVAIENTQLFEQTQKTLAETQRLYDISRSLVEVTTLEEIFNIVIGNVKIYNVDRVSISLLDRDQLGEIEKVTIVANWDRESDQILPVGSQISSDMFSLVESFARPPFHPMISDDLSRSDQQDGRMDEAFRKFMYEDLGAVTLFSAPMFLGNEYKGVLSISTRKPHVYTQEETRIYQTLADQAIIAIERHRLLEATRRERDRVTLLYAASRDFNSAQYLEDLLETLVKSFISPDGLIESGLDHMSIALLTASDDDSTSKRLEILAGWDKGSAEDHIIVTNPALELTSTDYPFIKKLSPNSPYEFRPEQSDVAETDAAETDAGTVLGQAGSVLAVPLTVGNNWLGVLFVSSHLKDFSFDADMVNLMTTLAGQVAVVIQNIQLGEETRQNLHNSEILSHLSQELLIADNAAAIYNLSMEAIAATEPDRGAAIFMYDQIEGGVELEIVAVWDNPAQDWPSVSPGAHFSAEELGLVPLLKTGQTIVSNRAGDDERFSTMLRQLLVAMQIKCLVAVPVWLNKEVNGFILIGSHKPASFGLESIRLYENIGRLTSGALEEQRLFEEAQHRAAQLQTAAEVSQAAASYLDLDRILSEAVYLLRDRFGFYHVSIFLVDEYQQYAIIEASTGDVGRQMLARKHKFEVGGQSIVGLATGTGKSRIALDVGKDAVYFSDPLLPDTRSEMALPLIARGRVIGALDVHSAAKGAFREGDIAILQSMANQLANAIEAARAFKESKRALDEVSRLHEHYLRNEWSAFIRTQKAATGYRLIDDELVRTEDDETWLPELEWEVVNQAVDTKQPVIGLTAGSVNGDLEREGHTLESFIDVINQGQSEPLEVIPIPDSTWPQDWATLVAPLTLHGEVVIGAVDFEISKRDSGWEEDTIRIVDTVANQAAQMIESVRLFEQTQAAREEAEALYEVGRALVASESEQEMFHTVLRKLLTTLGLKQGGILFFELDKRFGKLHALFEDGEPVEPYLRFPIEGNLSYLELIETKEPLAIEDVATDPLVASVRESNLERNIASILLLPIIINDEVVGSIGADAVGQPHIFTDREINLASAMADQLSLTLQNRWLLEETRRRAIQLQTSSEVGRVATSILDQDIMLAEAVELIKDHFGFYHAQIFLVDDTKQYALLHKSTGEAGKKLLAANYKVSIGDKSVIGQVARHRKSMVARDMDAPDLGVPFQRNKYLPEARAELAIPLQVGTLLIGILNVHSTAPDDFTREDISTIETLAAQLAIAIQNARAFREQQETAERLKEIDKLKTQFLANMSHELRTPLNSIIGFSRVILKGIDGPLTELQKADLTSIHNSGQHLLGLINNILDLSKIGAGKMELNFEEIEVGPIIKSVMATALALVKDKSVDLVQEVPDNLPIVWADPTRLRQVVLNLVSNACKFTDEGKVTLKARAEREKIVISVSDTGIGIPEEKLDSIFEEFTQVDASTTRKVGGTGLGLPISRHFIEMHKGQIWVDSKPGQGSTFSFAIPLTSDTKAPDTIESLPSTTNGKDGQGHLVIAIDDDSGVITLYKRFLKKLNYKVVGLNNSENVVDEVKLYEPFAILLDVLMPNKDGWSVLKALKADPFTKNIPVIICSIVSDKNRGFALGAADYLTKPIVESELINALKQLHHEQKEQVKVLVIDDKADDILLIRRILEAQSNYQIIEASNGRQGLELVKSRNPHLIILDLTMPEMDGFEVVETLKNDEDTQQIPIIIVSAKELSPSEHKRLTGQIEVLLRKGIFTENELLEDVSQTFDRVYKKEAFSLE